MAMPDTQANFVRHSRCPKCGSSDANAEYDDGHSFCFSCETHTQAEKHGSVASPATSTSTESDSEQEKTLLTGEAKGIPARGLTEETCRKYGYLTGSYQGQPVQVATYRDKNGKPTAQKLRFKDKRFQIVGNAKAMTLFGSHLWGKKAAKVTITEGELDCLSVSQVQGNKWPVLSLPNGAPSAVRAIKANLEYLTNTFSEIVLMFDQDEAGQKAAQEVAEILPVGTVKIAHLPCKDANQCLLEGKADEIISAIWQAKAYRPDGIVTATDYRDIICVDDTASSISYPYSMLNDKLLGIRKELVTILAGSGVGKTTFVRELAHHLHINGQTVGLLMLEENVKRTLLGLTGIHMSKNITIDRSLATDEEILEAFDDMNGPDKPKIHLYEGFGSNDIDHICNKIRYLVTNLGCKYIFLDHISILVSAMEGDERRMLDQACTKFRTLVSELDFGLFMVSHLRRPDGDRGHEAGAAVRLSQARGSHAIAQLSDACIAMQVDPDDPDNDIRLLRILKNRFTGETGDAGTMVYDRETGRLLEEELAALMQPQDEEKENEEHDSNETDDLTVH